MSSYWSFNSKKKELNIEMKSKVTNKYGFEIEPDNIRNKETVAIVSPFSVKILSN